MHPTELLKGARLARRKEDNTAVASEINEAIRFARCSQDGSQTSHVSATVPHHSDGVSTVKSALPAPPCSSDFEVPLAWSMLPRQRRDESVAACNKAWDMFWFVHGLSFNLIDSPLFRAAILATKQCPAYKPCCRQTLSTSHLDARNEDANFYKESRLNSGRLFGFLVTSDGWRNSKRRQYHNFLLVAASGPIYLGLKDVSGESGNAQAIHDEFVELFDTLAPEIVERIIIGCTDTPSANVSAWNKLEQTFPRMVWIGCMAHELSLLFKDWVRKVPAIKALYIKGKKITIWIKNHGSILTLFQQKVRAQYPNDKRKWPIMPYMPGDTRMATAFKLVDRLVKLKPILLALATDPAYVQAAQEGIDGYNKATKAEHRIPKGIDGSYPDIVASDILDRTMWATIDSFMAASKTSIYFLRMVDSNLPVLGKVYYTCALINKQLKILAHSSDLAKQMLSFFTTRWARWHKNVHVLAYAVDPSYRSHALSDLELQQCEQVLKRLRPDSWTKCVVELTSFKNEPGLFCKDAWDCVDSYHGYMWWSTFGRTLPELRSVSMDILSKQAAASSCEFNWSLVSSVERKGRGSMHTASTDKSVNVAAMHRLAQSVHQGVSMTLPTLDAVIEQMVDDVEDEAPIGSHINLLESVFGDLDPTDGAVAEEDEEEAVTQAELDRVQRAQAMLCADWSVRDTLLDPDK